MQSLEGLFFKSAVYKFKKRFAVGTEALMMWGTAAFLLKSLLV